MRTSKTVARRFSGFALLALIALLALSAAGARADQTPARLTAGELIDGPLAGSWDWEPGQVDGYSIKLEQPITVKSGSAAFSFERDFSRQPHFWDIADADRIFPFGQQVEHPFRTWHHLLGCLRDVDGRCFDSNFLCQGTLRDGKAQTDRVIAPHTLKLGKTRYRVRAYDAIGTAVASFGDAFAVEVEMPVEGDPDVSGLRCFLNASDLIDFGAGPTTRDIEQIIRGPNGTPMIEFESPTVADTNATKTVPGGAHGAGAAAAPGLGGGAPIQ